MQKLIKLFCCPKCGGDISIKEKQIQCTNCNKSYKVDSEIPLLFEPTKAKGTKNDVTNKMKAFYETTPFPNYEKMENISDLVEKARMSTFAKLLNEQIPFNTKILEVGCGTGQLTNYLGTANRDVLGTDMSLPSLKLGNNFKNENDLKRVGFYQMNLFKPCFKPESFDMVVCNGVLHHTSAPKDGFKTISKLVKKDGYILVGLYNKYGRLVTDIRRALFNLFGYKVAFLDPNLRSSHIGNLKKHAWFRDQYQNPSETKHTMGEVLKWFSQNEFEFINSIPKMKALKQMDGTERLFKRNRRGNFIDRFLAQAKMVFSGSKEGGFFIMIGKRKSG